MAAVADLLVKFGKRLQKLKHQAGNPSLKELEKIADESHKGWDSLCDQAEKASVVLTPLSKSTLDRMLRGDQRREPDWDVVATFVVACRSYADRNPGKCVRPLTDLPTLINTWQARYDDLVDDLAAGSAAPPVRLAAPLGLLDRHRAEVRRYLVPPGGVLDRAAELNELREFCLGDAPYAWWLGEAWAGKTALMAAFAAECEAAAEVEVVSFFVNARLASESTSAAMTSALVAQLYDIVATNLPEQAERFVGADWSVLLCEAAALVSRSGRRLLMLVDGLDEDRGAAVGSGMRSIAEILPAVVHDGLRVLVTSRPDYRLPDTVPGHHPLKACRPRYLRQTPFTADIEQRARLELNQLLNGSHAERTALGLVAASGGGLASADLASIARLPWPTLQEMFGGVFGRTVVRRDVEGVERVLFAHEALHAQAASEIGPDLTGCRQSVIDWARRYAERHWPQETPRYLLRDYPSMLRAASQRDELVRLATDADRHTRLLQATGGDGAALQEIKYAQDLACGAGEPALADLTVLADLAAHRDDLLRRNQNIPHALPGLWVRLGEPVRGTMLAQSISDPLRRSETQAALDRAVALTAPAPAPSSKPHHRIKALAEAIESADEASERDELIAEIERESALLPDLCQRAEALAAAIKSVAPPTFRDRTTPLVELAQATTTAVEPVEKRDQALRLLARAVALTGDDVRAEAVARTIVAEDVLDEALAAVARVLVEQRNYRRAEELVLAISVSDRRDRAIADLVRKTCQQEYAMAKSLLRRIDHPFWLASALLALAGAALDRGEQKRAKEFILRVRTAAPTILDDLSRNKVLKGLVAVLGRTGEFTTARGVARQIDDEELRADACTELAKIAATADRIDLATTLPRTISNPYRQSVAVRQVVEVLAHQDVEAALALAHSVREPDWEATCLTALAEELACAGDNDAAEAVVRDIRTPAGQAAACARLIRIADPAEQRWVTALVDLAVTSVASIDGPRRQAEALTAVADSAAAAGAPAVARRLAERAEEIARGTESNSQRVRDLRLLALARAETGAAPATGLVDQAHRCAELITDPDERLVALADVAHTRNAIGDETGALELVNTAVAGYRQGKRVAALVATLAEAGCGDLADEFAGSIADPRWRAQSLADIAVSAARVGESERATMVMEKATTVLADIADPVARVRVLARLTRAMTLSDQPKPAAALVRQAEKAIAGISDAGKRTQAWQIMAPTPQASTTAEVGTESQETDAAGQANTDTVKQVRSLINQIRAAEPDSAAAEMLTAQAATLARDIETPYHRVKTLGTLAHAIASSPARVDDLIDEAVRLADEIADPRQHSDALRTLALAAGAAGHRQRAHQLGARAGALIPPVIGNGRLLSAQRKLVQVALSAGDLDLAYAIAWAINDPVCKRAMLRKLVEAEARRDRVNRARTIAAGIELDDADPADRAAIDAWSSFRHTADGLVDDTPASDEAVPDQHQPTIATVQALIADDQLDQAEELARTTMPDTDLRVRAFTSLVTANATAGRRDHALGLAEQAAAWADTVESRYRNARLIAAIAEAAATVGEADCARVLADRALCHAVSVVTQKQRVEVLAALLRTMALVGDHQRCLELARMIGPRRDRVLGDAVAVAAEHNLDTALVLAGYVTDTSARSSALVAAARSQTDPAIVRTLVASALRHGSWTAVLADPAALPAEIVNAVADFVTLRESAATDALGS